MAGARESRAAAAADANAAETFADGCCRLSLGCLLPLVAAPSCCCCCCCDTLSPATHANTPTQILEELKGLRGKEGAPDYVELVFTRCSTTGEADEAAAAAATAAEWFPEEIGKLHLESGVDVQCLAKLELQGATGVQGATGSGGGDVAVDAVSAFLTCLRTDRPDGLMTTVVCDTMGVALGLVSLAWLRSAVEGFAGGAGGADVGCVV